MFSFDSNDEKEYDDVFYSVHEIIAMKKLQTQKRTNSVSINKLIGHYDIQAFHETRFCRGEALFDAIRLDIREIVDILIGSPDHITNFMGDYGITILHLASYNGLENVMNVILGKTYKIPVDDEGNDPMHYAVMGFNVDSVEILLKSGMSIKENKDGLTPYQFADTWLSREDLTEYEEGSLIEIKNMLKWPLRW